MPFAAVRLKRVCKPDDAATLTWSAEQETLNSAKRQEARSVAAVTNVMGIHGPPSSEIAGCANRYEGSIDLQLVGESHWSDAKSVAQVMFMAAHFGTRIEIRVRGLEAQVKAEELQELIEKQMFEVECAAFVTECITRDGMRTASEIVRAVLRYYRSDFEHWRQQLRHPLPYDEIARRFKHVAELTGMLPADELPRFREALIACLSTAGP